MPKLLVSVQFTTSKDVSAHAIPAILSHFGPRLAKDPSAITRAMEKLPRSMKTSMAANAALRAFYGSKGSLVYVLPATLTSFDVVVHSEKGLDAMLFDFFQFLSGMDQALQGEDWRFASNLYEAQTPSLLAHAQNRISVGVVVSMAWAAIQAYTPSIVVSFVGGVLVSLGAAIVSWALEVRRRLG